MAKHFNAHVISTSSAKNKEFVLSMGADEHIDYQTTNLLKSIGDNKIDIVIDTIAGQVLEDSVETVKENGMIITLPSDVISEKAIAAAQRRNIELEFMLVESSGIDMSTIAKLLENQTLNSHVSANYRFEEMDKAHLHVESGRTKGKVVVTV